MNLKKITAIAAAAVMAAGICTGAPMGTANEPITAITAEAASSDFVIKTNFEGKKYISEYNGKGGDIVIPDGVSYVYDNAFGSFSGSGNNTITSVTFPASCTKVGREAFCKCTALKKVTFKGDATIGIDAFLRCTALESVTVKGSIYYDGQGSGIGNGAFCNCISLKTFKIEKDEREFVIENSAFRDCVSLSSINIPSKCIRIGYKAFLNCYNLESLTIPSNTKIGDYSEGLMGDKNEQNCFGLVEIYNRITEKKGGKNVDS
ncbi:MAG: leucine-rich repeat domain-containing protein, partial [Muribaculaceae bacterium]|nr:leucine-rich repeat domain-containing protein [Muribaculaceae bacterium]